VFLGLPPEKPKGRIPEMCVCTGPDGAGRKLNRIGVEKGLKTWSWLALGDLFTEWYQRRVINSIIVFSSMSLPAGTQRKARKRLLRRVDVPVSSSA
jgi:hypothetical protein